MQYNTGLDPRACQSGTSMKVDTANTPDKGVDKTALALLDVLKQRKSGFVWGNKTTSVSKRFSLLIVRKK